MVLLEVAYNQFRANTQLFVQCIFYYFISAKFGALYLKIYYSMNKYRFLQTIVFQDCLFGIAIVIFS